MRFVKIKQAANKFDYQLLDRLIQDAKYFIEHPELKHLWTWDLNTHIQKMLDIYNSLDPKPEWTSEEEINNLGNQMKESYKNHRNEIHPDNKIEAAEQPTTPKPTTTLPDNMVWAWDPKANQWIAVMKDNPVVTPPTYNPNNLQNTSTTTQMYTPIKSTLIDSLNQFLDGDRYLREIKIEKGLISDGLIKFAGINPIKGPKYSITNKGLQVLKQAAKEEYDFEKDYIKARKSYLLDGISEEEFKTGAPESQGQMSKFSIFEKDGSELAQIEASNETDAKVKFFMENPEYEGSQTIEVRKVDAKEHLQIGDKVKVVMPDNEYWNNYIGIIDYIEGNDDFDTVTIVGNKPTQMFDRKNVIKIGKEIDSKYSETTIQGLDFPNQSVSPSTDIKVDTHGWVNQAANDNIDKKQTFLKTLVYQQNKKNGDESSVGLNLDFDNKAVATGDLESLSEIETKLKDEGITCNITHREDFPEMYELTVFYTPKSAPTDKFAALKKKANGPFEFEATKDSIDFIIDKEFLIKLINVEPELEDTKLDPKKNEFDYIVDYKLSSNIEWKIDFETTNYGIKNMGISVPWQTISIDIEYSPKSEAAPIKNDMSFSIKHDIIGVDIVMESENFNSIWMKGLQIEGEDYCKAIF